MESLWRCLLLFTNNDYYASHNSSFSLVFKNKKFKIISKNLKNLINVILKYFLVIFKLNYNF